MMDARLLSMHNITADDSPERTGQVRHNDAEEQNHAPDAVRDAAEQVETRSTLYSPERSEQLRAEASAYRSGR